MPAHFQSPLSNLCDVLNQIRDSAKLYQTTLTKNESSTRAVLIDPILRTLGWDTANTYMVEIEKTQGQVRADYALKDSNGAVRIIVEAKALGTNLFQADLLMSLVKYAFQFQIDDVFLTDGLIWHHYSNFQPKNNTPTKVLNLTTDNPVEVAVYLVQQFDAARFWPIDNRENVDVLAQRVEQLVNTVATLERLIKLQALDNQLAGGTQPLKGSASQEVLRILPSYQNLTFTDLTNLKDVTGKRPAYFRLPDNSIIVVKRWKDVLRESCKFALATNAVIPIPLPDRAGRKIALLSLIRPATGIAYVTEYYNGQEIFMYVNYDANNCVLNALHILQYATVSGTKTHPAVVIEA
ncbi:MAG: hypothetical protein H0T53_06450 [Herpetosiphonaceae bacterium]|nr:hypothetical protein [Herpetosiphonaceae bacterium]